MTKNEVASEAIKTSLRLGITNQSEIARSLMEINPQLFTNQNQARAVVCAVLGRGNRHASVRFKEVRELYNNATANLKPQGVLIEKNKETVLAEIGRKFTRSELGQILSSGAHKPNPPTLKVDFAGTRIKMGVITDTHIGHKDFNPSFLLSALTEFNRQGVDVIFHVGDVTEGMSHRAGHVYELTHIGYDAQRDYAVELFSQTIKPTYAIAGNHDEWFVKSNGGLIVKDIASRVSNFHYLGAHEADINLGGLRVKLWHGQDGATYAISYRLQRIINSLRDEDKPHILFAGHDHKYISLFRRNIYGIGCGSIIKQTQWMRGKKIESDTGFAIVDAWFGGEKVTKLSHAWYPFYY